MAILEGMRATENEAKTVPLQGRRKYDRSDKVIWMSIAQSPFVNIMSRKFMKQKTNDPEFRHWTDLELTYKGTLEGVNAAGTAAAAITTATQYFKGTNLGIMVQVGGQLYIESTQTNQTNASVAMHGETCVCTAKVSSDVIKVDRAGGEGTQSTNVTAASGNTLNWVALGTTYPEGAETGVGFTEAMKEETNYIEIMKFPWSATDTNVKTEFYGGNDFQHQGRKARDFFMRTVENKFLFGHKHLDFVDGEPRRTTGGVLEYILGGNDTVYDSSKDMVNGDGSERYWKIGATANLTKSNINKFIERLFNYGNPDKNKVALCAPGFLTIFQDLFDSSLRLQNGETSYKLAMTRYESSHGVLDLVADPVFYDLHKYDVIILDTDYVAYRFIPDMDIHIDKGPNGMGIQSNAAKRMTYQMYAQIGVDITFKNAHAFITGYNT